MKAEKRGRFSKRENWTVTTLDGAVIEYRIAKTGVRVAAYLLDMFFRFALLLLFYLLLILVFGRQLVDPFANAKLEFGISVALVLLLDFLMQWGYFALFELYYSGQTPGKRLTGIRVLDRAGFTPAPSAILLRNLIRFIDNLPSFHFIAVCVSSVDPLSRRLGDIISDTIVVHVKHGREPFPVVSSREIRTTGSVFSGIGRLKEMDVYYIRKLLEGRDSLNPETAANLAESLAVKIAKKINHEKEIKEPIAFLERVQDEYAAFIQE